ncbi:MAG: hypothetical protein ACXVY8_07700 [Gaiellaceae bacterium]
MRVMRRPGIALAVVLALGGGATLAGLASAATAGARSTATQAAYYGKTSQGLNVQLTIRGQRLSRSFSGIEARWCKGCSNWLGTAFYLEHDVPFVGNRISFHRTFASGRIEQWLELRRELGGRVITGWARYSDHHPGYTPKDSGKVSFTARLWASSDGAEWSGKTSDGKQLTMSLGYSSWEGDVPLTVTGLSRPLTCRDAGGTPSNVEATVSEIKGVMAYFGWWSSKESRHPAHTYSGRPARGSGTTDDGASVQAALTVGRLAPQGSSLAATGSLELKGAGCDPLTTTFTLRPR